MTLSMYQSSIPVFLHGLENLSAILTKAEAYAADRKIDPAVLIGARLYPDMFPLSRQIQITTDIIRRGMGRLAGTEVPGYEDKEASFAELRERIQKTANVLKGFTAAQIDGTEGKDISLTVAGKDMRFNGQDYLLKFVIPNFYFHISIAYAILRHNGVEIGKSDFLGNIQ